QVQYMGVGQILEINQLLPCEHLGEPAAHCSTLRTHELKHMVTWKLAGKNRYAFCVPMQSSADRAGNLGILRSPAAAERSDVPAPVAGHVECHLLLSFHRTLVWSAVDSLLHADGLTAGGAGNQAGSEDDIDGRQRLGSFLFEPLNAGAK